MKHRIITIVSFVAVFGAVSVGSAEARPTCGESGDRCRAAVGSAVSSSAFGEPLAALGGRSLAQYLADHMAGDRRLSRAGG
jgi:hypothetical protein